MKIDYPVIEPWDISVGDTVLLKDFSSTWDATYHEWVVSEVPPRFEGVYYLIDRPKVPFPEGYGTLIIAKRVRGIDFPEGVVLARQRGSAYGRTHPLWKSIDGKINGADNHTEKHIENWVLAKVVPVEGETYES